jgi:[ribosomal protein S5]-alanine N-acetyltransferase
MQTLETDRLILRPLSVHDAPQFYRIYQDSETMRYMGAGPQSVADEQQHIQHHILHTYPSGVGLRAVIHKAHTRLIGYCGLLSQVIEDQEELEIAYLIDRTFWGHGFATEAARRTVGEWRDRAHSERLVALVDPHNSASARVAEKLGMRYARNVHYKAFGCVHLYLLERG